MSLDLDKCQVCGKPLSMDQVSHCSGECLLEDVKQRQEKAGDAFKNGPSMFLQMIGRLKRIGKQVEIIRCLKAQCPICGREYEAYDTKRLTCNQPLTLGPFIISSKPCPGLLIFDEAY